MARKKAAAISELAAMILGCKEQWVNLLILADWMEERLGLSATAMLLRSPDLKPMAKELDSCEDFAYFVLASDVFVWLAQGHCRMDQVGFDMKPHTAIGLYAHPEGQPEKWLKIVGAIALEQAASHDPQRPWVRTVKNHPRIEKAREELSAYVKTKS